MSPHLLAGAPLFAGLTPSELDELAAQMRERSLDPGDEICRSGEPGDSLFVLVDGLAHVITGDDPGARRVVAKLRRGDVIGEMSLATGEPRTATVVAAVPSRALELRHAAFAAAIARSPQLLGNLNRILSRRLAATTAEVGVSRSRGEAITLVAGRAGAAMPALVAAAQAAKAGPVTSIDVSSTIEVALAELDDVLAEHAAVIVCAGLEEEGLAALVGTADRTVALVSGELELARLGEVLASAGPDARADVVLVVDAEARDAATAARSPSTTAMPVVRTVTTADGELPGDDVAWLGRHLARTKLGLALGAGGAKGYAHVGALRVLERAGYTVDYVSGSSIGAVVGAWIALGLGADEIEQAMRRSFTEEVVAEIFKLSLAGTSSGLDVMTELVREATGEQTFDDLEIPLVVMAVDLVERCPATVREGPLWEALLAATALAGLFPPFERDGRRLVDGIALVPVPTDAVRDAGADVAVSVNLISRTVLPAWPGDDAVPEETGGRGSRMLQTLLEVMDLAQLDSSERHAARADVAITPVFGPCTWRDFHLADAMMEAGREAAELQLPTLKGLAAPRDSIGRT